MTRVAFLRAAQRDVRRAAKFYAEQSAPLGAEFMAEVDHASELLSRYPEAGAPMPRGARKLLLRRFPYIVIYRFEPERVLVLAVGHQRRHPDFWLERA